MNARRPRTRRQRGQTLVGLMVGMLLSLLGIAAMLSLYKTVVDVSTESVRGSQRNGQLAAALVGAQAEAQQAGWGIDPAEPGEDVAVSADGRQVVWRWREAPGAPMRCAGLRVVASAPAVAPVADAGDGRGLFLLPATGCAGVDDPALGWNTPGQPSPRMLASVAAFYAAEGEVGLPPVAQARFRLSQEACMPYGQSTAEREHGRLALETGGVALFAACLPNLAGPPLDAAAGEGA